MTGTPGHQPTVKVIGYLRSEKGVGEGARATIRALRAGGTPFAVEVLPDPTPRGPTREHGHRRKRATPQQGSTSTTSTRKSCCACALA
jgi:hypothetical protein